MNPNKPKNGLLSFVKKIVIIISVLFALYVVFWLLFIYAITAWHIRKITPENMGEYAEYAFLPGIENALERFATRGMQDVESQLETHAYKSLDKLCEALPEGCRQAVRDAVENSSPVSEKDVKGKKAEAYLITGDLSASRDEADEASRFESRKYYVFKYKNGSYRFVIQNR